MPEPSMFFHNLYVSVLKIITGISFRILFFNIILISVPIIILFYLNIYERKMLTQQEIDLNRRTRLFSGLLSWDDSLTIKKIEWLVRIGHADDERYRIQVADENGTLFFDTGVSKWDTGQDPGKYRERIIYRWIADIYRFLFYAQNEHRYTNATELDINSNLIEIDRALKGRPGAVIRRSLSKKAPVVLSSAFPVVDNQKNIIGVVRISRSANDILHAVYESRYKIVMVFLISLGAATLLNIIIARTILRPIKRLDQKTRQVIEEGNHPHEKFTPLTGRDEISNLSRTFYTLIGQLEKEIRANQDFVDDVVHEFRNPLTAIRSAAETAAMADNEKDRNTFLEMIAADVARMESLLSAVKELSLTKKNPNETETGALDMISMTEQYFSYMEYQTDSRIELIKKTPEKLLIQIKREKYFQILDNLLNNAFSFSEENKPVTIEMDKKGKYAVMNVKDLGCGIPEAYLDKIFDRFYSIRPDDCENRHTGLGLSIVKSIVENMSGKIEAKNRANGGACFIVTLPIRWR